MSHIEYELNFPDGRDALPELKEFSKIIGLDRLAPNRYSIVLLLQLYGSFKSGVQNPAKIISQIEALEVDSKDSGLKPATQFKGDKLGGLWHQHYMEDGIRSLAINIDKGLKKYGMPWVKDKINDKSIAEEDRFFTEKDAYHIANDVVVNNFKKLKENNLLTGEWLVFAKNEGKNYYLCIGKHETGDEVIRNQIDSVCAVEFPFLNNILP